MATSQHQVSHTNADACYQVGFPLRFHVTLVSAKALKVLIRCRCCSAKVPGRCYNGVGDRSAENRGWSALTHILFPRSQIFAFSLLSAHCEPAQVLFDSYLTGYFQIESTRSAWRFASSCCCLLLASFSALPMILTASRWVASNSASLSA